MNNELFQKVLDLLLTVPSGRVVTYGQIAKKLGNKGLSRVVGNVIHKNPDGDRYPCYKVVNAKGHLSQSYAFGGIEEQKRRLISDGIEVTGYTVDLQRYLFGGL